MPCSYLTLSRNANPALESAESGNVVPHAELCIALCKSTPDIEEQQTCTLKRAGWQGQVRSCHEDKLTCRQASGHKWVHDFAIDICELIELLSRSVEWVLLDGMTGGSGEAYDWAQVKAPEGIASKGWLLAGGLGPHNVAEAVQVLAPTGVDVSSGVTDDSKLRKDPAKVHAFVSSVQQCP